jgi:hypothetical protein
MKDKSSKPPIPDRVPDREDSDIPSDRGIWNQSELVNQEWRDAPTDKDEEGVWESDLANQEWRDAPTDEDEAGIWEQPAIAEWTEAPETDDEEEQKDGMIFLPKVVESLSYPLIPLIGYGFLGLTLFDHINIIYPVKISEPGWIVETLGQLSERIPTLWIGLLLVFFRREGYTRKWEVGLLKILSWLSLLLGIIYLLMIPMLIGNTARVYRLIDTQIDARSSEQAKRLERAKEQVNAAKEKDISAYLQYLNNQNRVNNPASKPPEIQTPKEFKENLLIQANRNLSDLQVNTQNLKDNQFRDLIKRTTKWTLGNLLSAFVCIWIWHLTRWTRIKNLELDSKV